MKNLLFLLSILSFCVVNAQGPYTVPYSTDFEEYASDSAFQIDWTYDNTQIASSIGVWAFDYTAYFGYNMSNCIVYGTSSLEAGDDWVFSPGFTLQAGTNYTLSFLSANGYSAGSEALKLYIGSDTSAATMTTLLEDYSAITGTTFTNKSATFSVPTNGTYYLGFFSYTSPQTYSLLLVDNFSLEIATGIEDNDTDELMVYPNPSSGVFRINNKEKSTITVYDLAGNVVVHEINATPHAIINLSTLDNGTYITHITNGVESVTTKISLQK